MPIIVATQLRKSFGSLCLLNGISISIEHGERVGLVGVNGSGKSTLAKVLAGLDSADDGTVAIHRDSCVAYLSQAVQLNEQLTARQVVLQGMATWYEALQRHNALSKAIAQQCTATPTEQASHSPKNTLETLVHEQAAAASDVERLGGWDRAHVVDAILGHIGLRDLDKPVGQLSGGDQRRVALAQLLVSQPDLAILDEPSNHLDVTTVAWLERFLIETYQGALLLITHDRYLLDRVVTRTIELENGNIHSYPGGYESYLQAKHERIQLQNRTESNRQNLLRTELQWLKRQPKARTGKQKARIKRVEQVVSAPSPTKQRTAQFAMNSSRGGKTILELHDIGLELDRKKLFSNISLILNPSDRLGIVGPNGIGKTSLLRCMVGELPVTEGQVIRGKKTTIAYFDQHRGELDLQQSVFDNVAGPRSKITLGHRDMDVHAYLERFLFTKAAMFQPVGALSGGEKARVALAKMLSHEANLLVLDEPTNDLDVATLSALESWLLEFPGASIVVTHDRWMLNRIATRILSFENPPHIRLYAGNYDDYCEQKRHEQQMEQQLGENQDNKALYCQQAIQSKSEPVDKPKGKGLTYAQRLELAELMEQIAQAEAQVTEMQKKLADPEVYTQRADQVKPLQQQLQAAQKQADELMERWEQLELLSYR